MLVGVYLYVCFILIGKFSLIPAMFFFVAIVLDFITPLSQGIKRFAYVTSAMSVFLPVFGLFLIYLPFAVFGSLLNKRSFLRNYILGFTISFIPINIIYIISTYLSVPLNKPIILLILYIFPLIAILLLKKKSTEMFEIDNKEFLIIMICLLFTTIVASGIINDQGLFMSNGVRIFTRVQFVADGLRQYGEIPIYNPGIAQGEATYLWNTPSFKVHAGLSSYLLKNFNPILMFNAKSFFILLMSVLALSILLRTILNVEESSFSAFSIGVFSCVIGLNFFFLQMLESFKQFYAFSVAYLYLSLILQNPKSFKEFLILMYISVVMITIHLPYGAGILVMGGCLFLLIKIPELRTKKEFKHLVEWLKSNKKMAVLLSAAIILFPLFYLSSPLIFGEFLAEKVPLHFDLKNDINSFIWGRNSNEIRHLRESMHNSFSSLGSNPLMWPSNLLKGSYPNVGRIDDFKFGFFIYVFGIMSFFVLLLMHKTEKISNWRRFVIAYAVNLIILAIISEQISHRVGGFYRTVTPFFIIALGASIMVLAFNLRMKYFKYVVAGIALLALIHFLPYGKQNINNTHQEYFASGQVYKNEIEFIKRLPADGRIMTYGLFSNAVDFGGMYLTGKYFSRNERIELAINRTIFEKIHGQNSFGEEEYITTKSGQELANYLRLGGYKYLFINIQHPIGYYVVTQIYPNFTYPLFQDGPFVMLAVNGTSYAEKVDLVKNIDKSVYKMKEGYKYVSISKDYGFDDERIDLEISPMDPEPLYFRRDSPTKIIIGGNFDNDWVVFKEQYFTRWKAKMNGQEIPVYATNNDVILVRTLKGNELILEYKVLPVERVFGILSLIGAFILTAIILFEARSSNALLSEDDR